MRFLFWHSERNSSEMCVFEHLAVVRMSQPTHTACRILLGCIKECACVGPLHLQKPEKQPSDAVIFLSFFIIRLSCSLVKFFANVLLAWLIFPEDWRLCGEVKFNKHEQAQQHLSSASHICTQESRSHGVLYWLCQTGWQEPLFTSCFVRASHLSRVSSNNQRQMLMLD